MRLSYYLLLFMLALAPVYGQDMTVFDVARKGTLPAMRELYRTNPGIMDSVNEHGSSPLILAAYTGNRDVALFLADHVKNINYNAGRGTALMAAVMSGDSAIIQKLLALHANPDLADQEGKTALMYAVYFNKNEIATQLIKAGANTSMKDNEGRTALDIATFNKNTELIIRLDQ